MHSPMDERERWKSNQKKQNDQLVLEVLDDGIGLDIDELTK